MIQTIKTEKISPTIHWIRKNEVAEQTAAREHDAVITQVTLDRAVRKQGHVQALDRLPWIPFC